MLLTPVQGNLKGRVANPVIYWRLRAYNIIWAGRSGYRAIVYSSTLRSQCICSCVQS